MGMFSPSVPSFEPPKFNPDDAKKDTDPLMDERLRRQKSMGRQSTILSMGRKLSESDML